MNVRIPYRVLGLWAAAVLMPALSAAQSIPSPYRYIETKQEVGLILGRASVNTGRFGYGPSGGTIVGVRWGINLSGPMGLEVVATGIKGTRDVIDPTHAEGNRNVGTADVLLGTIDGRLRFSLTGDRTWHDLAPFIVAGAGVVFDLSGNQSADSVLDASNQFSFSTSFFGTMGGGVRWMLTDRLELRGDGVFSLWKLKTPPGFSDSTLGFVSVAKSEWVNGGHFTLSTAIRF
jgi:hypothetical protein